MKSKQEVDKFLEEIRVKVSSGVSNLIFLNGREKNAQALLDLDITPNMRKEIIEKLKSENFIELKKEITLINMRCMHLVKL